MLPRAAYKAGPINAVAATRAAHRRRSGLSCGRTVVRRVLAEEATAAVGDGVHRAATHAQARRNGAARQLTLFQQPIDFLNELCREHGTIHQWLECGIAKWKCALGDRLVTVGLAGIPTGSARMSAVVEPEITRLRQWIKLVVVG